MVYPLYLVNWDQPESRGLITKSIRHWHALTGAHRGYSYTGAASMYAMTGDGDTAITYLREFFDTSTRYPCQANTHYTEAGPVIETPLSASQSLHDMFCQSWGGVIRVFPAVPSAWADLTLHDFRTQGAFLVSAVRTAGKTRFIRIRSLAGEPLKLKHGLGGRLHRAPRRRPPGPRPRPRRRGALHRPAQGPRGARPLRLPPRPRHRARHRQRTGPRLGAALKPTLLGGFHGCSDQNRGRRAVHRPRGHTPHDRARPGREAGAHLGGVRLRTRAPRTDIPGRRHRHAEPVRDPHAAVRSSSRRPSASSPNRPIYPRTCASCARRTGRSTSGTARSPANDWTAGSG